MYTFLSNTIISNYNANGAFTPVSNVAIGNSTVNTSLTNSSITIGNNSINSTSTNLVYNAGGITATNNMTLGTKSGLFYIMPIASGVNVLNLPPVSTIPDGYNVCVRATGTSNYATTYIQCEAGKQITYREYSRQTFNMIGKGEMFRFTWIQGMNIWLAECLIQPGELSIFRSHAGSGVWNGTGAAWNTMFFTTTGGATNAFGYAGYSALSPVIGVYQCSFGVRFSAAVGGGVSGYGYLAAATPFNNTPNQALAQTYHNFMVNEDDDLIFINWTFVYDAGQYLNAFYLTNTGGLYHYYDANQGYIMLVSR